MPDGQVPERRSTEERRVEAAKYRARWAGEVEQALRERNLSIHAAARRAGISPGALQGWLHQDIEPSPRAMESLARVIGRPHLQLLQLLGWLPRELYDTPLRMEASERLHEALSEVRRWVEAATAVVGFSGGTLLADALLKRSDEWEVTLRKAIRGRRFPLHHSTYVAVSRVRQAEPSSMAADQAETDKDRGEIEGLIGDVIQQTAAYWRPRRRAADWNWARRPDLVLASPVLLAGKPRGLKPNLNVSPPSVVVIGIPFAGAGEIGALLATALDWGYTDLITATRQELGSVDITDIGAGLRQTELAQRLLEQPRGFGRFMVWSCNSVQPILETLPTLADEAPLIVFIDAPESLCDYAGRQLASHPFRTGVDSETIARAQELVRRILRNRDPQSYVTLRLPEILIEAGGLHDVDEYFDTYVELAFEAAAWLERAHGSPPLRDAPGMLADLWRDAHLEHPLPGDSSSDSVRPSVIPEVIPEFS
jgi:transcriptional regulator with XRE-family HTH domain